MKMTEKAMQRLANCIIRDLKAQSIIEFKVKEDEVIRRAISFIKADYQKEAELDNEVNKMMDDLERQNAGEFQRYKMFPMLKKRLAKEKGIVL